MEIRTYWSTYGYTNLPAGRYRLTVTDACGATTVREYQLGAVSFNPKVNYEKDCEVGKINFNIGRNITVADDNYYERVYLQQEIEDQWGYKS